MSVAHNIENPPAGSTKIILANRELERIAKIMDTDAGIFLSDEKSTLVHSRLVKRLRVLQLNSFVDYCNLVESEAGKEERKELLLALTTNLTRFFREPHHFEHLIKTALPPLIAKAKRGEKIRIWSAGCSNGQEAYSIAAVILSLLPNAENFDIKILASDIDRKMVMEGRKGFYSEALMQKMPTKLREKHFESFDDQSGKKTYCVSPQMKSLVAFRVLNLNAASWPMKGKFHIIFCRNTVIYFNEETQEKIWTRYRDILEKPGYLYIGHSERLSGSAINNFIKDGVTTYKLKD